MKTDLKKCVAAYTARRGRFDLVPVPAMPFLMIDGHGDPNTSAAYGDAIRTLYPVAYGLKFLSKNELGRDYVVMPLEALWWSDDMSSFTTARDKSRWDWTAMIALPNWTEPDHLDAVRRTVEQKGGAPALDALRLQTLDEGLAVQTLHVGPYDEEGPVLQTMHEDVIPGRDLRLTGKHHEVYLSDPRRAAPERLRTILRQPVAHLNL